MKSASILLLSFVTILSPASAADRIPDASAMAALTWLKRADAELKKSKYGSLAEDQLATLSEVTLGGHRKSDGKHIAVPAEGFRHLDAFPSLRKLVLWENDGVTDEALGHIGKLKNLRELELGDAPITSSGIMHLRGLQSLEILGLGWTKDVGDAALPDLVALAKLETLVLSGTKVTDEGLKQLVALKQLKEIRLAAMPHITDAGLRHLGTLPALRSVHVNKKTGVTQEGIAAFRKLRPDCEVILK